MYVYTTITYDSIVYTTFGDIVYKTVLHKH